MDSPWGGGADYYPTSSHYERYIAEEALAGNLATNMKLGDTLSSPEFNFHHSPGGTAESPYNAAPLPQQQQPFGRRGTLSENEFPFNAYNPQNGTTTAGSRGVSTNHNVVESKADLDFIESLDPTFDCNVDEVLQNELSLGGDIDFNFGTVGAHNILHAHLQQQHQAQQSIFSPLQHHIMSSSLGSNGTLLGQTNPNVTVTTTSSSSASRPWVH